MGLLSGCQMDSILGWVGGGGNVVNLQLPQHNTMVVKRKHIHRTEFDMFAKCVFFRQKYNHFESLYN